MAGELNMLSKQTYHKELCDGIVDNGARVIVMCYYYDFHARTGAFGSSRGNQGVGDEGGSCSVN